MSFGVKSTANRDVVIDGQGKNSLLRLAVIRRDPEHLFVDLPKWFASLSISASDIISLQQTESNGNITLSILYRV